MAMTSAQAWRKSPGWTISIVVLLTVCYAPVAFAYDSARLADALESLTAESFPQWEAKARGGNAVAQDVVGMAYKYGEVTAQDHVKSLQWFLQAAEQGDADAQFNLGRIYGKATGFVYEKQRAAPRDDTVAVKWYRKAADQGYAPAQLNLATMYLEGSPALPIDRAQGYFWLQQAAAAGDQNARSQLEKVRLSLTQADKKRLALLSVVQTKHLPK